ncbi:hypothetical protein ZWY2020_058105 [Hordeum vulgare]|nr:hypothetical protein ZWY2020_058105 [Hordeum vulgare]
MAPRLLASAVAAVALLLPGAARRVLLSLDDFGAVGDIANDTQVRHAGRDGHPSPARRHGSAPLTLALFSPGIGRRVEGGVRRRRQHLPQRASRQVLPDLARHARRPCRSEIKLMVFPFFLLSRHSHSHSHRLTVRSNSRPAISGNIVAPESPESGRTATRAGGSTSPAWGTCRSAAAASSTAGASSGGRGPARTRTAPRTASTRSPPRRSTEDCQDVSVKGHPRCRTASREHLVFTRCYNVGANYLRVTSLEYQPSTASVLVVSSTNAIARTFGSEPYPADLASASALEAGENQTNHKIEKIKTDTMFISTPKNGVRVKTYSEFAQIMMRNVANPSSSTSTTPPPTGNSLRRPERERGGCACIWTVNLTTVGGGNTSAYCHQAFGKHVGNVLPESCLGKEDFVQLQAPTTGDEEDADCSSTTSQKATQSHQESKQPARTKVNPYQPLRTAIGASAEINGDADRDLLEGGRSDREEIQQQHRKQDDDVAEQLLTTTLIVFSTLSIIKLLLTHSSSPTSPARSGRSAWDVGGGSGSTADTDSPERQGVRAAPLRRCRARLAELLVFGLAAAPRARRGQLQAGRCHRLHHRQRRGRGQRAAVLAGRGRGQGSVAVHRARYPDPAGEAWPLLRRARSSRCAGGRRGRCASPAAGWR